MLGNQLKKIHYHPSKFSVNRLIILALNDTDLLFECVRMSAI